MSQVERLARVWAYRYNNPGRRRNEIIKQMKADCERRAICYEDLLDAIYEYNAINR